MFFLSISIVGSLISFLVFNFSKKEKIFMGDTGSMVIGFLLAYQAINFLSVDFNPNFMIQNNKAPVFILALFSFPIIDTTRVFLLRLIRRKSPFEADKNHIHHVFLGHGLKHWKIAVLGSVFTMIMVLVMFLFNELSINKQTTFLAGLWIVSVIVINNLDLVSKLKEREGKENKDKSNLLTPKVAKGKTIVLRDMA
jgi:UDP-N-acetylmuramyl pentapeptide phosphotransferase/UDP-N-acetylglucosamine-1-phosphate transferase